MEAPVMADFNRDTETGISILGERDFTFEGDAHRVVTFLNQTLKYKGFIFGVSQNPDGTFCLRIYEVKE